MAEDSRNGGDWSIGGVLGQSFARLRQNAAVIFGLTLLLGALPQSLLTFAVIGKLLSSPDALSQWWIFLLSLFGGALGVISQGAVIDAALSTSERGEPSFGRSLATGLSKALPLLAIYLVITFCAMLGMLLLVVPGIIIYCAWAVAAPAMVAEGRGIGAALQRSRELTKGSRWKIFGLFFIVFVPIMIIVIVLQRVGLAVGNPKTLAEFTLAGIITNTLWSTVVAAFVLVLQTTLFIDLRAAKEGTDVEGLATIFE